MWNPCVSRNLIGYCEPFTTVWDFQMAVDTYCTRVIHFVAKTLTVWCATSAAAAYVFHWFVICLYDSTQPVLYSNHGFYRALYLLMSLLCANGNVIYFLFGEIEFIFNCVLESLWYFGLFRNLCLLTIELQHAFWGLEIFSFTSIYCKVTKVDKSGHESCQFTDSSLRWCVQVKRNSY